MLTPQEVSERAFPKASFGGYNMGQVDEFLDLLTADYTALYNENAVLKNKMKVLVEKVEEYRSTEEAMRKALMTAQRMAEDMVSEAQKNRDAILQEAEAQARAKTESIRKEIDAEKFRLESAQSATAIYVARIRALHEKELAYLDQLHELAPNAAAVQPAEDTLSEIDDNVQRLVAQAMADATAENQKVKVAEQPRQEMGDTAEFPVVEQPAPEKVEETESTRRIDFGNLQFGRDYEIK